MDETASDRALPLNSRKIETWIIWQRLGSYPFTAGSSAFEFMGKAVARDQDLFRRIHRNDGRDPVALNVAVPYANIIVSEKYWGTMVRKRGLAVKYNTTILTDARDLPAHLAEMGCL